MENDETKTVNIKAEALKIFQSKVQEMWPNRPVFQSNMFCKITDPDILALEVPTTLQEIRDAMWACRDDKSPSPNSFTFKFIKK